ncbi:MAG TPA: NUDIX hydrolase [Candidatus Saccharimonadales bacterium]|jgi:ADP-ribose pyrophosphatase YjhB (NUDIX family)|nr:NUDIX hydrolase [Candidatus Saccharimonadales bacterium]
MERVIAKTVPINEAGEILFLYRSLDDTNRPGGLDFPGGEVEAWEDPATGAAREGIEEVGIDFDAPQLIYGLSRALHWGTAHSLYFRAFVQGRPEVRLSHEHSGFRWMTLAEALQEDEYLVHQQLLQFMGEHDLLRPETIPTVTSRALVTNTAGKLLIVRRGASDPLHPGAWDLPGGRLEPGETFQQAAVRETEEEVGITIQDPKLVFVTSNTRQTGTGTWLFYAAGSDAPVHLGDEHDASKRVLLSELPSYTTYDVLLRMGRFLTGDHPMENGGSIAA